jgi:hypothetical protein
MNADKGTMTMCKPKMILIAIVLSCLSAASRAQVTNINPTAPATRLEALETNVGVVIIMGTAPAGSISVNATVVSVTCKEDTDTSTNQKEYGILVGIRQGGQPEDGTVIDYDELESLVNTIDYFSKIDWTVTPLTGFDAFYVTKAGLRIAAFGSKHNGTIQFAMRSNSMSKGMVLSAEQLAQFKGLIVSAQHKLDSIRTGR